MLTTLTRKMIEAAVEKLYTNGQGEKATRLVLVNDKASNLPHGWNLGGLAREFMVDSLCKSLEVED